jgi:hypothetical protein
MKLKRAALISTATAVVTAGALAAAVTLTSAPAKADAADETLIFCNLLSGTHVAIDAWDGGTFSSKAPVDECGGEVYANAVGNTIEFFLDNLGVNIGHLTFAGPEKAVIVFTGTKSHATEHIFIGPA